ncbi:MAG: hypothetical protein QNJ46_34950 [Leptolyngbyaceae cyanobacterium MO_188.B28]|nr:hypothetical protein [Leptolyngbyaceae cyanobacterium MO_188.B28]
MISNKLATDYWTFTLTSLLLISSAACSDVLAQGLPIEDPVHSSVEASFPIAPRLFLDTTLLTEIRSAIAIPGSHHHIAFAAIKDRVDRNDWRIYDENPDDGNWNYARAWLAREASFLYLITGEQAYAQIAFDSLYTIHSDPDPDGRIPEANNGLSRAATGMGFALAYDWAASGWTPAQQDYIRDKILIALEAWRTYKHANFAEPFGSNWVSVCRGSELIMMLVIGEDVNQPERFSALKLWLREHIKTAYGNTGLTQEGQGYLAYAGGFLMPAIYALRSIGNAFLEDVLTAINFEQLPLYAGVFNPQQTSLQFGVGGGGLDPEGFTSFLLDYASPDMQPYYQYFYDRYRGLANSAPAHQKFDHRRAGSVWSLLYYPTDTLGLNPTGILPRAIEDREKGGYLFRNRWQDANDILIALIGDFTHHRRSWDQPETFGLRIHAHNTQYFGGPAKERDVQYYSKLLIDGQAGNPADVGGAEFFEARETGGYVIVDGGSAYGNLGVESAKRHLLVDFSDDESALISTLDQLAAIESHIYTWQANLGATADDGGITVSLGQEGVVRTFLLQGNNNSYLKGWILSPHDITLRAGDPLQIETEGATTNLWVVMQIGTGLPPIAQVTSSDLATDLATNLDANLYLDNIRVYFDTDRNQIVAESVNKLL